jgi:hypothetical protein
MASGMWLVAGGGKNSGKKTKPSLRFLCCHYPPATAHLPLGPPPRHRRFAGGVKAVPDARRLGARHGADAPPFAT